MQKFGEFVRHELPFTCDGDGIGYDPEPGELARQQRLQRYAMQRDQIIDQWQNTQLAQWATVANPWDSIDPFLPGMNLSSSPTDPSTFPIDGSSYVSSMLTHTFQKPGFHGLGKRIFLF